MALYDLRSPHLLRKLQQLQSPIAVPSTRLHRRLLGREYYEHLDLVNELEGHEGCVNALCWSADGSILLSGGDDQTIRLWRIDEQEHTTEFPFTTRACLRTGHTANIFNVQFLANSSKVATCAGDNQIRVFDINRIPESTDKSNETVHPYSSACLSVLRCHTARVKRLTAESSPDHFLSVAEDGTVRLHDLRTQHSCSRRGRGCPPPLVHVPHDLSTLAVSALTPHLFVVAGESPYGLLFDRRQLGRNIQAEWGIPCDQDALTTCVRIFGRRQLGRYEHKGEEHVTGARMSQSNSDELLLSYSSDAVHLYNIRDDLVSPRSSTVLEPNQGEVPKDNAVLNDHTSTVDTLPHEDAEHAMLEQLMDEFDSYRREAEPSGRNAQEEEDSSSEAGSQADEILKRFDDKVILSRLTYNGACNVRTVKDVNFLGHFDQYVTSGSDDGNFFIWEKENGAIVNILEGDGSVVNVIEQNPCLPCVAVSGIDHSVKIFGSNFATNKASKKDEAEDIVRSNRELSDRGAERRAQMSSLLARFRVVMAETGEAPNCSYQ
ncbi:WD40 repeat-like protein [Sistotremastrum niveocremeum HHB9708]|uniref:WD40 repeat-like protein n=1 Tax=Sistotremastrum niveocremeum HHB9708 TaxID=1314777 RepID=A0A164ZFZ4_9AGAM|nr:WD40 repeat-like protein [Sistotremastrum niveocremeum HHB9708]